MIIYNTNNQTSYTFDLFFYLEGEEKNLTFYHINAEETLRDAGLLVSQPIDGKYHMSAEAIEFLKDEVKNDIARHEEDINSTKILPHDLHKGKRPHFAKACSPLFRYYSTQRPIAPGTYPKPLAPHHESVRFIKNFDERTFVEKIGMEAWGYIEYDIGLTKDEMSRYELVRAD